MKKLAEFVKRNKGHEVFKKHIVLIFDECHRSQFGDMHKDITGAFKNYHIFGFTGTPIFAANAVSGGNPKLKTTVQAFGCYQHGDSKKCPPEPHQSAIHTYTIVDAINDKNVLGFRIDYINTIKADPNASDRKVKAIDKENALLEPKRISDITQYILEHFDQKTYRNQSRSYFTHRVIENVEAMAASKFNTVAESKTAQKVNGFNSIFAVSGIPAAKLYYTEFQKQMAASGKGTERFI